MRLSGTLNSKSKNFLGREILLILIGISLTVIAVATLNFTNNGKLEIVTHADRTIESASDVSVKFSNPNVCKVDSIEVDDRTICVTLEPIGKGETFTTIKAKGFRHSITVMTNSFGLLKDGYTQNFAGWKPLFATFSALLLYLTVIFYISYRKLRKKCNFSYISIANLGLFLLFLIFSLLDLSAIVKLMFNPDAATFSGVKTAMENSMTIWGIVSSPVALIIAVLLLISNLQLIRKEGFRFANALGIILALSITVGLILGILLYYSGAQFMEYEAKMLATNIYFAIYNYFLSLFAAVLIIFISITRHKPSYDKDCIVILGCAIRKDGTLYPLIRGRVDKAIEFAKAQEAATGKKIIFIPSGGQGSDEIMPEAEAMKNYLISQGIPEEQIRPETESTTTIENMRFSKRIAEDYKPDAKAIFSTTNYHVFRSGIIASSIGWNIDGIGSPTKWYFWPNALIREIVGMINNNRIGAALLLALMIAGSTIASMI